MTADLTEQLSTAQKSERAQLLDDFEAVLSTVHGKNVMLWLLEQCRVYGEVFSDTDGITNLNLGRRDVGLRLIQQLEGVAPTAYAELLLYSARARVNGKEEQDDHAAE